MLSVVDKMWREDESQDIAEYALMLVVVLLLVMTSVRAIGTQIPSSNLL